MKHMQWGRIHFEFHCPATFLLCGINLFLSLRLCARPGFLASLREIHVLNEAATKKPRSARLSVTACSQDQRREPFSACAMSTSWLASAM